MSVKVELTEAEQEPFFEHTDPSNSDASPQALIKHVEAIVKARMRQAWDEGADAMNDTEPGYPIGPNPYEED